MQAAPWTHIPLPMYRLGQAWTWLTVVHSPLRLKLDRVQNAPPVLGQPEAVIDGTVAAERVGFVPWPVLGPAKPRLSGQSYPPAQYAPQFSVLGETTVDTVVSLDRLRQAGVADHDIPKAWNGTVIHLRLGPTVVVRMGFPRNGDEFKNSANEITQWDKIEWDEVTLVQGPMPRIMAPDGFDVNAFTAANLRAGLLSPRNALHYAALPVAAPAILLWSGTPGFFGVSEVKLRYGTAIVIEQIDTDSKVSRMMLLWSRDDRMYVWSQRLGQPCSITGLDFAGVLANAIRMANAVRNVR